MSDAAGGEGQDPGSGVEPTPENPREMIPRARLNETKAELLALQEQAKGWAAKEAALRAQSEAWAVKETELTALKAAQTSWTTEKQALGERVALARAGIIDDDHEAAIRAEWVKLAEDKRPASLADLWLEVKAKPADEVPRILRGFLDAPPVASASYPWKPKPPPVGGSSAPGTDTEAATARDQAAAMSAYTKAPTVQNLKALTEANERLSAVVAARKARVG